MQTFWKFIKGILLRGETSDPTDNLEGSLWYNSTSDRFKGYAESAVREVVTTDQTQTLSNKTLSGSTITDPVITVEDVNFTLQDNADNTKQVKFQLANIGTGVTRTYVTPNSDGELTVNEATQTLLNKTIDGDLNTVQDLALASLKTVIGDANEVLHRDGTGAVTSSNTMPSGTIVGTTDTQTLTNKTIDGDLNTVQDLALASLKTEAGSPNTVLTRNGSGTVVSTKASPTGDFVGTTDTQTVSNKNLINTNTIRVQDTLFTLEDNAVSSKTVQFELSGISAATNRTFAFPDANTTLVGIDATQTLSNKTIDNSNAVTTQDVNFTLQDNGDTTKQLKFQLANLSTGTTRTYVTPNVNGEITINEATQTLLSKTLTSPLITTGVIDDGLDFIEESSFTNPSAGRRRFGLKTDGKLYLRDSSGNEKVIGEGSSSGINYIDNPDAETDTTGWATYADAAGSAPVDGTGGAPNVTFTRTTSTPLRGTGSFLFTKDAANRQGQGASYAFTIDDADKAKVLNISMDYEIASGTYADGDLTVYIYDVTNALVIQPTGYVISNVGIESRQTATFQTASNSTSYRLIFHVASTSASAYTVKMDNVIVGPSTIVQGTPVTDWVSYTPTIGLTGGTTSAVGMWRRVGDTMEVQVDATFTTVFTGGSATISLPSGYSIDTDKVAGTETSNVQMFGEGVYHDTGGTMYYGPIAWNSSTLVIARTYLDDAGTSAGFLGQDSVNTTQPFTWGNGDRLLANFRVPIAGWSSNVQMSADTDTRVVAARYERGTSLSIPDATFTTFPLLTKSFDTHEAYNTSTGAYTVPVSGIYRVSSAITMASSANWADGEQLIVALLKNGSQFSYVGQTFIQDGGTILVSAAGSTTVQCVAGDTLSIQILQNSGAALNTEADGRRNHLAIERLSGPSVIAASETVAFRAHQGTTSIPNNTSTDLIFPTKFFDSHNAYNTSTGIYTVPVSGVYEVSFRIQLSAAAPGSAGRIFVANTVTAGSTTINISGHLHLTIDTTSRESSNLGCGHLRLRAGDTVKIQGFTNYGVTTAMNGSSAENWFSMVRVGNY